MSRESEREGEKVGEIQSRVEETAVVGCKLSLRRSSESDEQCERKKAKKARGRDENVNLVATRSFEGGGVPQASDGTPCRSPAFLQLKRWGARCGSALVQLSTAFLDDDSS
jgi:hypothetical protein